MTEEKLGQVRFFEFLTEEEREEFAEGSELATFEPGEEIIEEGAGAHDLFVLTSGRVEARKIPHETFRRMISEGRPAAFRLSYRIARPLAHRLTRLDEEVVEAIRELERRGETDLDAFRDKLITDWAV